MEQGWWWSPSSSSKEGAGNSVVGVVQSVELRGRDDDGRTCGWRWCWERARSSAVTIAIPFSKLRPRGEMGVPGPTGSSVMSTTMADVDLAPAEEVAPLVLTTEPTVATPADAPGLEVDNDEEEPEPGPSETTEAEATVVETVAALLVLSDAVLALIMVVLGRRRRRGP